MTDALVTTLTGHLTHEEKDGLPLIGVALTASEWRGVGFKIARQNGLSGGGQMFSWMLDGATPEQASSILGQLPPPVRVLYKAVWKPRYVKTERWLSPGSAGVVPLPGSWSCPDMGEALQACGGHAVGHAAAHGRVCV